MKTFIKIYISLSLILSPIFFINSANAATVGGWSLGGLVADGASSIVNGTKQVIIDGKDYIKKGVATVTPTATNVAKVLSRGVAGYALSVAVEQLLGAVDWVLDPANNQVKYYPKPTDAEDPTSKGRYCFNVGSGGVLPARTVCSTQASDVCNAIAKSNGQTSYPLVQTGTSSYGPTYKCGSSWTLGAQANPAYDPSAEKEEKTIPLETVAQKVISNAESDDTQAQVATTAAAQDIINDAEQDETKARPIVQQLEASASTENADSASQDASNDATGTSKPNTANPEVTDIALEFPTFCGWAPVVCEAAQVVISFPTKVEIWVSDAFDLGQRIETEQKATTAEAAKTAQATQAIQQELTNSNDLPQKDTSDVVLPDLPITPQTVNVNWGNSCPPPTTATLSMFGQSTEITLINYDPICEWAWVVEYSVIALASISSVFIVAGRKT